MNIYHVEGFNLAAIVLLPCNSSILNLSRFQVPYASHEESNSLLLCKISRFHEKKTELRIELFKSWNNLIWNTQFDANHAIYGPRNN